VTSSQIPAFEPEVDSGLDPSLPGHDPAEPLQRAFHRVRMARSLPESILVPAVGTLAIAALAAEPLESGALALLVFACASFIVPERPPWATLLPLMRGPLQLLVPLIGTFAVGVMQAITGVPGISLAELGLVFAATSVASLLPWATARRPWSNHAQVRIAVIGSQRSTDDLARELRLAGIPDYLVVGRISVTEPPGEDPTEEVPRLGSLDDLGPIVREQGIQLLVMSSEAPRFLVFDEVSRSCLQLPVRLWELSAFYEDVFGHVAVAEINSAWFQYIMHPKYRRVAPASKRALDIMIAAVVGLLFLPLLALFAPLIARDGGSVFFYQTRIGEGGRPLRLIKLRTMRNSDSAGPQWATDGDDRITPIGRFLRRTHLDEMPQLLNVLKGEMSLVGPRPEQPEFVERLEDVLPFYQRRHLLKPGLTGWAQVRCGYAGSDVGSAWKLSHDLYYLKHGSMGFDIAILLETFRTVFADRRYAIEPKWVPFIHGHDPIQPVEPVAAP
jgi:exopolysaccharide biosynthesis polyprenyl glycosylphosphotransferase